MSGTLLKQGAEAKLYSGDFFGRPCITKERFAKGYRHPVLDKNLTNQRIKSEVRANLRCRMSGIKTPTIFNVDTEKNTICMEHIHPSCTVRDHIAEKQQELGTDQANSELLPLAEKIGETLSQMHASNIIHGDLTTSNMLLQGDAEKLDLVLIDFGLSGFDASPEDKGVDLYVLERALLSSHPNTQQLFDRLLVSYRKHCVSEKSYKEVFDKLDEIRMRGRKRTMVG